MAIRPVFIPQSSGDAFVVVKDIEFTWFAGFAVVQKQKSIKSLHQAIEQQLGLSKVLEISSKSLLREGVAASAFNLMFSTSGQNKLSVECAFQGSKVFEKGGAYVDLYESSSKEAKQDTRLKNSGSLVGFEFFGQSWPLEPKTLFYDWLYLNALQQNMALANKLCEYSAFTDIEFNPNKSINCQAYAAALYVALSMRGLLKESLYSPETYKRILAKS